MEIPSIDAFVLLLYLLPGFLATQIYRARYPAKRIGQFEAVVWSVLHSFVIHLLLGLLGSILNYDDLNLLARDSNSPVETPTIAVLLGGGFAWGLGLIAFHWLRTRVSFLPSPDPQAIWPLAAGGVAKEQLWALARTKGGTLYLGWIERYSFDPEAEDHDFLLCPAFEVNAKLEVQRDLRMGGVYLNTRDLDSLERVPGGKEAGRPNPAAEPGGFAAD